MKLCHKQIYSKRKFPKNVEKKTEKNLDKIGENIKKVAGSSKKFGNILS